MNKELIKINHKSSALGSNDYYQSNQLSYLASIYFQIHVLGSSLNTIDAKRRDLGLFISFFKTALQTENIDLWTPSITKAFQNSLLSKINDNIGKPYKATSVNRIMSTLKHFSRWICKEKSLPAGDPFQGVKIVEPEEPSWNGLNDKQILRLKTACEQRLASCKKANQNPLLENAIFYLLINTGLRESELVSLNYGQYHHKSLHDVARSKSKKITRKVPIPQEARDFLDNYLQTRKSLDTNSPLFITKHGNRITRFEVIRICRRISQVTNAYLNEEEKFILTPHMLRHTFLKRIADKHDVHVAQKMSGNVSIKEIFRYTQPSDAEIHNYAEMLFS